MMSLWGNWVWEKTHYFSHRGKEGERGKSCRSNKSQNCQNLRCSWLFSNLIYTDDLPQIPCQPSAANLPNSRQCLDFAVFKALSSRQHDLFTTLVLITFNLEEAPNNYDVLWLFAEEGEDDAIPEEPHANPRGVPVLAQKEDGPGDS